MRLSEAIRLGSMLKPKCEEYLWSKGRSCALGAACDAVGIVLESNKLPAFAIHALAVEFPELNKEAKCPACGPITGFMRRRRGDEFDVEDVIVHLNDNHKWKRERIADWVAQLEQPMESVTSVGAVDPVGEQVTSGPRA